MLLLRRSLQQTASLLSTRSRPLLLSCRALIHVQIRHSNQRLEVTGDTFEVKDLLKRARMRWDGMTASWWTTDLRAVDDLVQQLQQQGVEVTDERDVTKPAPAVKISSDPASGNVVVTGATFPMREELKAAGFRWAPESKAWVAPAGASKSAIAAAAQTHGLDVEDESEPFPASGRRPSSPSPSSSSSSSSGRAFSRSFGSSSGAASSASTAATSSPASSFSPPTASSFSSSGTERFPPPQPGVFQRTDQYRTLTLTQSDKGLYLRGEACRSLLVYLKAHGWQFRPFERAWFKDISSVEQTIESLRQEATHKQLTLSVTPKSP